MPRAAAALVIGSRTELPGDNRGMFNPANRYAAFRGEQMRSEGRFADYLRDYPILEKTGFQLAPEVGYVFVDLFALIAGRDSTPCWRAANPLLRYSHLRCTA